MILHPRFAGAAQKSAASLGTRPSALKNGSRGKPSKKRPNFLLIVADDLGYSDVGAFGGEISTPYLDWLAMEGVRFTDFHSAPACSPTRAMLMTGTDPHLAGIGTMLEVANAQFKGAPGYEGYLNDRVVTVAELLGDAGYETFLSGKWHLGASRERSPWARGFQRSFTFLLAGATHFSLGAIDKNVPISSIYVEDSTPVERLPEDFYSSDYFADKLIQYLSERQDREKPFFAYLPFMAPHWPLQAPESDIAKYKGFYDMGPECLRDMRLARLKQLGLCAPDVIPHPIEADTKPWSEMTQEERAYSARTMEVYAAMVDRMDQSIGRVITYLDSVDELKDTIIVFLSDNGAEGAEVEAQPLYGPTIAAQIKKHYDNSLDNLGKGNSCIWYGARWAQAATAPSRMHKAFTTEGGIRVTAFVNWAGFKRHREIGTAFTTAMDVMPTFLELAGVKHPHQLGGEFRGRKVLPMRGKSLVCYLNKDADGVHAETATGWELFGRRGLRLDDWKALFIPRPFGPGKWQLYNLRLDPGEVKDLSEQYPERLAELLKLYEQYALEVGIVPFPVSVFELLQ